MKRKIKQVQLQSMFSELFATFSCETENKENIPELENHFEERHSVPHAPLTPLQYPWLRYPIN